MGLTQLIQIAEEEKQKLEQMGAKAYAENIINNEEIYGSIPEKRKEKILSVGKGLSELEEKETTEISSLGAFNRGLAKIVLPSLGGQYRIKRIKKQK